MSLTPQKFTPRTYDPAPATDDDAATIAVPLSSGSPPVEQSGWLRALAIAGTLALLVVFAAWVRGSMIWPESVGLNEAPYDDEGVYATAAQLMLQGKHPYRDFFYAHPPLGPALLAPAADYHFTPWGSPTTFMLLRYASLAYGALTVGLVFLIGWRLWGYLGGLLGGALLAIDPLSVWAGRHVMLEGPLLFLMALAVLAYVLACEEHRPPPALLLFAGFFAAAAGGVKLQGLVILLAMVVDLLIRRRGLLLANLLAGSFIFWLPFWGYLTWLDSGDPLGQFIFLQLLRPSDGIEHQFDRADALWAGGWLLLVVAALALVALPALLFRPAGPARRRRPRRVGEASGMRRAVAAIGATSRVEPEHPSHGWTLLLPWLLFTVAMLAFSRSFYAHYGAHLSLPLAILAGAVPLIVARGMAAGWGGRLTGLGVTAAACLILVWLGPSTWEATGERETKPIYTIVSRYATDAVGPDAGILALDAQFSFRAARRPAREDHERFLIDSYGMLMYHGLAIEGMSPWDRLRRVATDSPGRDPYVVMWRPAAQNQLRESIKRSDLVIIDKTSDGRLTDETRRWLATQGELAVRQEDYVIYRIKQPAPR
jgi:4-amino-4-deoxy-L-arabinose transferase-like glycosyltransferase